MARPKTMTARITSDVKKLWSCKAMNAGVNAPHKGELPSNAGQSVTLLLPGEAPSPFCQAKRAWRISAEDLRKARKRGLTVGHMYCEHQLDLDLDLDESFVPRPTAEADDALGVPREWREQHNDGGAR